MASSPGAGQFHTRLDASAGRSIVYCHECHGEWYQDERGLRPCPACGGEFTEIVSRENDPRQDAPVPGASDRSDTSSDMPRLGRRLRDSDSDPEEEDLDEHIHFGPSGYMLHRRMWDPSSPGGTSPAGRDRRPLDPQHDVLSNFMHLFNTLHGPGGGGANQFGGRTMISTTNNGMGGTTRITISGPIRLGPGGQGPAGRRLSDTGPPPLSEYADPRPRDYARVASALSRFSVDGVGGSGVTNANPSARFFNSFLNDAGPPPLRQPRQQRPDGGQNQAPAPPDLATSLAELLSMLGQNMASARHGDAVYSQEAMDRIITSLMEANPQSNAPPPATTDALQNLERKVVDDAMLESDGSNDCPICIEGLEKGQTVAQLPCKHCFHDECVVLWLKQHNTCPVCRTAIEGPRESPAQPPQPPGFPNPFGGDGPSPRSPGPGPGHGPGPGPGPGPSPLYMSRGVFSANRDARRGPNRPSISTYASRLENLSNNLQNSRNRRDSRSPMSPVPTRVRQRSPSHEGSRRNESSSSGSGVVNWFRGRFSNPDRERHR